MHPERLGATRDRLKPICSDNATRSYAGWIEERKRWEERRADYAQGEEQLIAAAKLRRKRREEWVAKKNARRPIRAAEVATFVHQLAQLGPAERIDAILRSSLPIDVVPSMQIEEIADALDAVPQTTLMALLRKIDRRKRGAWGRLKRAILEKLDAA